MNYQEFHNKIESNYYEVKFSFPFYTQMGTEEHREQKKLYHTERLRLQVEFELEFKAYIEEHYIKNYLKKNEWKIFFDYVYDAVHSEGYLRIFEFGIEIIEAVRVLFVD